MPIRKEDKHRYPADWAEIRERILKRAQSRCEQCGAPNRKHIYRGDWVKTLGTYMTEAGKVHDDVTGAYLGRARASEYDGRAVWIVLTIAHLDHTPENNSDENLKALCQQCHNRHDIPMRVSGRWRRKHRQKACGELV